MFLNNIFSSIFTLGVCTCLVTSAQQLPPIANFANNQLVYNPSAAGMMETEINASFLSRLQWSGIKGAPLSYLLWGDYRLADHKSAVGLNVNNQSYGVTKTTDLVGNYSYTLRLSKNLKFSMGLRLGMSMVKVNDLPTDRIWDANDPFETAPVASTTIPQAGTGFRISGKKFYAGLSAPDLISIDKSDIYHNQGKSFFAKKRNYVAVSGYKIQLTDAYALNSNAMLYYVPSKTAKLDLNASFEIRDYFWAGATYSSSNYHSLMVGTHISSSLKATYAFQFGLGSKIPARFFTHEICLLLNLDAFKK